MLSCSIHEVYVWWKKWLSLSSRALGVSCRHEFEKGLFCFPWNHPKSVMHTYEVSQTFFLNFLPLDLESPVTFFVLDFWGFWKCLTGFPQSNSDVTFRVDDFSYINLFNPSSYAKVMPILQISRDILQIKSKFIFVNFLNN